MHSSEDCDFGEPLTLHLVHASRSKFEGKFHLNFTRFKLPSIFLSPATLHLVCIQHYCLMRSLTQLQTCSLVAIISATGTVSNSAANGTTTSTNLTTCMNVIVVSTVTHQPDQWSHTSVLLPYLSSCAIAAICSTLSWWAARSLSKASCFRSRALTSDRVAVS